MKRWRERMAFAAVGMLATAGALGGSLAVLSPAAATESREAEIRRVLGEHVVELPDGLFEVRLADGTSLVTHGGDPVENHGTGMGPGDPERMPACATDYYQHVLYGYPSGGANQLATKKAQIVSAIKRMNYVLNEEAIESGNTSADFKVLCDATGNIQVDAFAATGASFSTISSAARNAGFNKSNVDYTIFFDGTQPGVCGVGSFSRDERLIASNANNNGGAYGITYSNCWDGRTPMHENGHNQGAVQYNAPDSTGSGAHCLDLIDVMCYSDGGDKDTGTFTACATKIHYDCDHDTYFDAAPEPGEYLASNWNIGSPLNRFIRFGTRTNEPPQASFTTSCLEMTCTFADTSTDADGTVTSRQWNFGDGTTGTGANPSRTYAAQGTYTVTLTVTDNEGGTASASRAVVVPDPDPATPNLDSGVARHDLSGDPETWKYYKIYVPTGATRLTVNLNGPGCALPVCVPNLDLYVRRLSPPTTSAFDCASRNASSVEACVTNAPAAGFWYVGVRVAFAPPGSGYSYSVVATVT